MFLSNFLQSKYVFQTISQSFHIPLSQNSIRTRILVSPQAYYLPAGVLINRRRDNFTRGRGWPKNFFFRRSLRVPKIVAQCRKMNISYLYIFRRTIALPNALSYINTSVP